MPGPERTQKQIAERYKGNLAYYRHKHPWRRARFWVSWFAIFGGIAAVTAYHKRGPEKFFTVGKISSNHATFADDCAKCHDKSITGSGVTLANWMSKTSERFHKGVDFNSIDRRCETCHQQHTLHEPNVVENRSCSACHQEHQGPGAMRIVASSQCASCHNNSGTMELSAQKGRGIAPAAFHLRPTPPGQVVLALPRPARGYTEVFSSFASGHPEFQLDYDKAQDPDALRFNHQRHEAADIPSVNGRKLDCNYCHKPDVEGRYYERVSFAANCQACHALQFDPKNPELTLPHGNAANVRAFLRTLPTQYAELAVKKGLVRPNEIQSFVSKQMLQLRDRVRTGADFEREVFYTGDPYKAQRNSAPLLSGTRPSFPGCAFCHEVKAVANAAPEITKPIFIDRWMPQAGFDHAKHASVKCDECHHAHTRRETSDVLMPSNANCVSCHSPQGRVSAGCITCHKYHAPPQAAASTVQVPDAHSVRTMMLGANSR